MMKTTNKTLKLCLTAMFMALICIVTMLHFPIPLGYAHLGNSIILIAVYYFNTKYGILAGSVGSALADMLTGYNEWIIPTLLIKALMAGTAAAVGKKSGKFQLYSARTIFAVVLGMSIMVVLYTLSGALMYQSLAAGFSQTTGLALEGIANIVVFFVLGSILNRVKIFH